MAQDIDEVQPIKTEVHRVEMGTVQERVIATPERDTPDRIVSTPSHEWEKVRNYVLDQIERCHGPFPRDVRQENTIFMAFAHRWEGQAMKIARYAFTEAKGMWMGAPIAVHRFGKTADSVFAKPIVEKLIESL